ncbi:TPA: ErmCL family antibiotic resistance leader peptide, partial [Streptococcus suis]|nr:ErmCL family antibiotic resistance leader peptide [Streptococcus suis]HEM6018201.1 ErmCL family antibiotic resistance leader peptide [Streptococcus suis]HEM6379815.1 ErmCL family antibiotic resistance leader peptide [Streptococcus suis]HEM6379817.1 ErmCL family antibiotic resistance leader peptide [Streptococcus suis]HEM6379819.1 ErmCL family antibiotic resistance leader peptide [Streptococcus suis]
MGLYSIFVIETVHY